jgi:DNA-binding Xre family transcriptional regulator
MIHYGPLWETLKSKNISQYQLIHKYHVSAGQLDRIRKNKNLNTYTINMLCKILECEVWDIMKFEKESSESV